MPQSLLCHRKMLLSLPSFLSLLGLLPLALQGYCETAAASESILGERAHGLRQRPATVNSSASVMGQQQTTSEVGILSNDLSLEREGALGLLERRRNEVVARDLNTSNTAVQRSQEEKGDDENAKKKQQMSQCSRGCKKDWLGDGWCDSACNTEACGFDEGDCLGWCSGDCKPSWEGDGYCDAACYVAACNWDRGDCSRWREQGVDAVERRAFQQKLRQFQQHRLQLPECKCERRLLVNGSCTPECNVPECLFDGGECLDMCNAKCSKSWLGDGDCDRECDTPECAYDKGDCASTTNATLQAMRKENGTLEVCDSACRLWMIGNGVCDKQCNNTACGYDNGDCDNITAVVEIDYSVEPEAVYQFCAKEWIGDGHCDANCYNKPSRWDGGDCEGTAFEVEQAAKGVGPQFDQ